MQNIRKLSLCFIAILVGCADLPSAPRVVPSPQDLKISTTEYGNGVSDPPKDRPVRITRIFSAINFPTWNTDPFTGVTEGGAKPAEIIATMWYDGYHASITVNAFLRERTGAPIPREFQPHGRESGFWHFSDQYFDTKFPILMRSQCGGSIEADILYKAWWLTFDLQGSVQEIDIDDDNSNEYSAQRDCVPCPSGGGGLGGSGSLQDNPSGPSYDPYGNGGASEEGCDAGEESGGGSGTQFQPGDNTGGETVDFGTGVGNGGTSMCGAAAVVEYVCIDVLTEEGWRQWECGYVTSC